jgi:hypothetical protein
MKSSTLRLHTNRALNAFLWLKLACVWLFAASLSYYALKTSSGRAAEATAASLNQRFAALEGMTAEQRESAVSAWLAKDEGSVLVILASHACGVYDLSACSDPLLSEAVDRAVEKGVGGALLAPVRFASYSCLILAGDRCPLAFRSLNRHGARHDLTRIIERMRTAHYEEGAKDPT